ncbi:MAG: hypothetical protein WDN08_14080 [Rhizomicrobium sp.]
MRVFDTFLFDGEFDLLEHRLRETFDLVDVFVLVEAAETFRGQPKPLLFRENRARFAWAASKIRPLALSRLSGASPWDREAFQRDAILLALRDAAPEDIVMILDADEIMSRDALTRLHADGLDRPHRPAFTRHYEAVNLVAPASACCPRIRRAVSVPSAPRAGAGLAQARSALVGTLRRGCPLQGPRGRRGARSAAALGLRSATPDACCPYAAGRRPALCFDRSVGAARAQARPGFA